MKIRPSLTGFLTLSLLISPLVRAQTPPPSRTDGVVSVSRFFSPPDSSRPSCYWWWFNCWVTKASITRDLEALRAKGMGGVMLVCSSNMLDVSPIPEGPTYLSPAWIELYQHALREAHRLGLELGVNLCPGWDMGGPWIPAEKAGRWYLQSELHVQGPSHFSGRLPLPGPKAGYDSPPQLNVKTFINLPLEKVDYRDTALIAFREPAAGSARLTGERAALVPAKANRLDANCFQSAATIMDPTLRPWRNQPGDQPIAPSAVVDLTDRLRRDGTLDWDVPAGHWVILRTGHRLMGQKVSVALKGMEGYEVDWFSREATDLHFAKLGQVLVDASGPLVGTTLKYFATDSFEDGYPNWTPRILEEFKKYRGYDPTPYLPVLGGRLVGSADISDRFLNDYRRTLADCMANNNYGRLADLCHQHGLLLQAEAAGPSWSQTVCFDAMKNLGRCDLPEGEFWQDATFVDHGQNQVIKQTASAAHLYGRKVVSAEAFTSFLHWREAPGDMKPKADRAFCEGVNRLLFHTVTASNDSPGKPGFEYGFGTHFTPNVTWWDLGAQPWISYVSRCSYLLQQGLFVADVLYYNGDSAPNLVAVKHIPSDLGPGYDYDVCNAEVLLTRLAVVRGKIVLPDGMSYRILVLPANPRMPVAVLEKIRDLVKAGATVVGAPPATDSGLRNYPECDRQIAALVQEVWGNCDGRTVKSHAYGRGRMIWNQPVREILLADGIAPDLTFQTKDDQTFLDYIHRSAGETEIYFVVNRKDRAASAVGRFRAGGKLPELWDPVTGRPRAVSSSLAADGTTFVPLEFAPYESTFVIFRPAGSVRTGPPAGPAPRLHPVRELLGTWQVHFDPRWGGPDQAEFPALVDWTKRPEPGIKYYSGTAVYRLSFDLPAAGRGPGRLFLDLGEVKDVARLRLNGQDLGTLWTSPWRLEITPAVKAAGNHLEIEVVNLWPNRLIGDGGLPARLRVTRTNVLRYERRPGAAEEPLLPSGLLGPVAILAEK